MLFRSMFLNFYENIHVNGQESIIELSDIFSEKITEGKYSCAEIQGYFINHKYDPKYVVDNFN